MKIISVIVLYNPDNEVLARIENLSNQCDKVIVFDNSDQPNKEVSSLAYKLKNTVYAGGSGNEGIGAALSYARSCAISSGYDWLLTMDQDTDLPRNYVHEMLTQKHRSTCANVAIFGPIFHDRNNSRNAKFPVKYGPIPIRRSLTAQDQPTEAFCIITSGAFISVSAMRTIGDFRSEFFIDYIDNEYCLRAWQCGFKVLVLPGVCIEHSLGNRSIEGKIVKFSPTNYSHVRKYYMTRNRLEVYKAYAITYPLFILYDASALALDLFRVFAFETGKKKKLLAIKSGALDFINRKFGCLN